MIELIGTGHRRISAKLDLVRLKVLGTVAEGVAVRPGEIAAELKLTASAVSRHLAALADAGQVELTIDPDDRRKSLVAVTAAGRRFLEDATDAGVAAFVRVIGGWTEEQVQEALRAVVRLNDTWAEHHAAEDKQPRKSRRRAR